jgi:uncharacterized protein
LPSAFSQAGEPKIVSTDDQLRRILERTRTIAVVGASGKPIRPSFGVARFLCQKGYRVIPVNPGHAGETLHGETVVATLHSIPQDVRNVEMVDIFRRSDRAGQAVDAALDSLLDRGLKAIWMQIGVIDEAAAARAEARGVEVVMNRCPKIDYPRLFGDRRVDEIGRP